MHTAQADKACVWRASVKVTPDVEHLGTATKRPSITLLIEMAV